MPSPNSHTSDVRLPSLRELGTDLTDVTSLRRIRTIAMPFVWIASYAFFAWLGWWPLAILSMMALAFVTYGSTSHDLVHRALHLSPPWNDFWLTLIEGLSLRSGTAYRLTHLHHHRNLLAHDDVESAAAFGNFWQALASGPATQLRLWTWAWKNYPALRRRLAAEAIAVFATLAVAGLLWPYSVAPAIYCVLAIGGSWFFPLITVYIPHDAQGATQLTQTRIYRGWLPRLVALDHLYHFEHHAYPAVPHHHWKRLADRLDPHLRRLGLMKRRA